MSPFPQNPQKILVRSTNWIGDAVMTTPAVRTIRENFPESEITMLVHPWVSDIFRYSPRVDRLFLYEKKGMHSGPKGMLRLANALREEQFDCALLLQNAFEAALIAKVAGIPVRGGYTTDARGLLLTHGVRREQELIGRHQVHYYQRMLLGLGLKPAPTALELFIPGYQIEAARAMLEERIGQVARSVPLIGFNPGAAFGPAKRWPAEKFAQLAELIGRHSEARILIFGSAADSGTAAAIMDRAGKMADRLVDFTGATSLIEAMALIGECDVFVSNDSGLMHVAAALHTPLVAVFGSTDHIATGPFSENAIVVRKPLSCSPCKKTKCPEKHFRCMQMITAAEVYAAVIQALQEK
ncbi:lipopolysaccharide heptosyltransferase II [Desulfobulbus alkaliphilus]|uniref:lipopolysaccharide heptosyltransferase II n=1 Tax=Desulfobulbus alkaliphilus TaxID=869814 RepID=UPI001965D85A|nr:lipopolysaccharide heptosyltransferase II [Desulfobulbus alkaliphilus]MBM9537137.1 lipopolysaccharide heptosyltransferase II [Desulfobulbus alkaliphilus]